MTYNTWESPLPGIKQVGESLTASPLELLSCKKHDRFSAIRKSISSSSSNQFFCRYNTKILLELPIHTFRGGLIRCQFQRVHLILQHQRNMSNILCSHLHVYSPLRIGAAKLSSSRNYPNFFHYKKHKIDNFHYRKLLISVKKVRKCHLQLQFV